MALQRTVLVDRKASIWPDWFCLLLMSVLQLFAIRRIWFWSWKVVWCEGKFPFSSFLVGSGFAFTAPNWLWYILHKISITSASPHGYHLQLQNRLLAEETLILLACSSLWKKLRWCLVLWPRNCIVLWLFLYSYILYFNVDIINVFCWFFKGITERWRVLCILTVEY